MKKYFLILLLSFQPISIIKANYHQQDVKSKCCGEPYFGCNQSCSNSIGREALKFTNQFRRRAGKTPGQRRPLQWNQKMADLGRQHSKNMAVGKVPFGHAGFLQRVAQFPPVVVRAAENVARTTFQSNIARIIVNGWSRSPSHRRNMLRVLNKCGIGVYRNRAGVWYMTQELAFIS